MRYVVFRKNYSMKIFRFRHLGRMAEQFNYVKENALCIKPSKQTKHPIMVSHLFMKGDKLPFHVCRTAL